MPPERCHESVSHGLAGLPARLEDEIAPDVARHRDQRVPEIDRPALPVGETPVLEDLRQDLRDVGMRFLDLVEQDHRVGTPTHRFGELPSFLEAHVPRRGADEAGDGVLLHVLRHVDPHHRALIVEEELGERADQLRLSHPGRAEEEERAERTVGILEPGAGATNRVRHGAHRFVLPHDPLLQPLFHVQNLLQLPLDEPLYRDPAPPRDHLGDVLRVHLLLQDLEILLERGEVGAQLLELFLEAGDRSVADFRDAAQIPLALRPLFLNLQVFDPFLRLPDLSDQVALLLPMRAEPRQLPLGARDLLLDLAPPLLRDRVALTLESPALDFRLARPSLDDVDVGGHPVDLDPEPRGGLVDQVDRLVRELTVRHVAMRKRRRRDERGVLDLHPVVNLITFLQAAEDRDRVLGRRFTHVPLLEPPLEVGVLLDPLSILLDGGGADAVKLAAGERRLQEVRGVERTLRGPRAHQRVQLVDEKDHLALGAGDFLQDRFEPLLELSPVLRAGQERTQIEGDHAPVLETLGHVTAHDPLREPLDDRRFPNAGLADQDGIVLRAPREHLDHAPDLLVPADHGIELPLARKIGQVPGVFLERLVLLLGIGIRDLLAAADALESVIDRLARRARVTEDAAGLLRHGRIHHREEEVLRADVLVLEPLRLGLRVLDDLPERRGDDDLPGPGHLGELLESRLERLLKAVEGDPRGLEDRTDRPLLLLEKLGQQVLWFYLGVTRAVGALLRRGEGFLTLRGETVEAHTHKYTTTVALIPAVSHA